MQNAGLLPEAKAAMPYSLPIDEEGYLKVKMPSHMDVRVTKRVDVNIETINGSGVSYNPLPVKVQK